MELSPTPIKPTEQLEMLKADIQSPRLASDHKLWNALNTAILLLEQAEANLRGPVRDED